MKDLLAPQAKTTNTLEQYKTEAKKLHRAATSRQKSRALPILRRLLKSQVFVQISLVDLFRAPELIKRKHLFQLLAKEAGYQHWAELKQALSAGLENQAPVDIKVSLYKGYPNLWFSNLQEAIKYTEVNGGEAMQVGQQAMVKVE